MATTQQIEIAVEGNGIDLVIDSDDSLSRVDSLALMDGLMDDQSIPVWSISTGGELGGTMSIVQSEEMFFDNDPGMSLSAPLIAGEGTQ